MSSGEGIELATTGQRIVFRRSGDESVVFESYLPAQEHGLALPTNDLQEQRFEVIDGALGFAVGGAQTMLTAGGRLTVPRGTPCRYWNAGTEQAHLVAEIRPALDFEDYARRLSGANH